MTLDEVQTVLEITRGGYAEFWQYSVSHKSFALRLARRWPRTHVLLVCLGCERVSGPTSWKNAVIEVVEDAQVGGVTRHTVRDVAAAFEVRCGSVAAFEDRDGLRMDVLG